MTSPGNPEDEFAELETGLGNSRASPAERLRGRVLAGVAEELARERRRSWWNFAAGLAATLLVGLNLSLSVPHSSRGMSGPENNDDLAAAVEQVSQALPELPPAEIRRELVLLRAGARLALLPKVPPLALSRAQPEVPD